MHIKQKKYQAIFASVVLSWITGLDLISGAVWKEFTDLQQKTINKHLSDTILQHVSKSSRDVNVFVVMKSSYLSIFLCQQGSSLTLVLMVVAAGTGGTLQYGYNLAIMNAPTTVSLYISDYVCLCVAQDFLLLLTSDCSVEHTSEVMVPRVLSFMDIYTQVVVCYEHVAKSNAVKYDGTKIYPPSMKIIMSSFY